MPGSLNNNSLMEQSQDGSSTGSAHLNTTFLNDTSFQSLWHATAAGAGTEFEGDPDKRLISTNEVAWLVRMFHDISCHLNQQVTKDNQVFCVVLCFIVKMWHNINQFWR
jgi:hypothetical protein